MALHAGQIIMSTTQQTSCSHHRGKPLDWFCQTCNEIVCAKCVSTVHKGHDIIELCDISFQMKEDIRGFINDTEENKLNEIQHNIVSTDESLFKSSTKFEEVEHELKIQGEKLKREIDALIAQNISLYNKLENENVKLLKKYRSELESYLGVLKAQVEQCKKVLQTGKDLDLFYTQRQIQSLTKLPAKPALNTAKFSPIEHPLEQLEQAFGTMSVSKPEDKPEDQIGFDSSAESLASREKLKQQQFRSSEKQRIRKRPPFKLSGKTEVISEARSPCIINSMCPTVDDGIWSSDQGTTLTYLNKNGEILRQIDCPAYITDISISPTTNNIWACSDGDKSVMEITSSAPTVMFNTKDKPTCICITRKDQVLVGMRHRIIRFTPEGKEDRVTRIGHSGKSLICSPCKISECCNTENVAVVDRDWADDGGKNNPHVLVMDKFFRELFYFKGNQQTMTLGSQPFDPRDVTFDRGGNLMVADHGNRCVHLLSGSGQYLRVLHADKWQTTAIGIDCNDVLWVVFDLRNIKLLQYTNM